MDNPVHSDHKKGKGKLRQRFQGWNVSSRGKCTGKLEVFLNLHSENLKTRFIKIRKEESDIFFFVGKGNLGLF